MIPVDPMNRLLAALEGARTPGRKMRVLVRAWRALRRMSPEQRKLLAAEVGSDGAEELLEQLSDRQSGVKPALLMQALERLRGTDPSELVQLAEEFRRPEGRQRLVDRGLAAARKAIAGTEPPEATADAEASSAPVVGPAVVGPAVAAAIAAPVAAALPLSKPEPKPKAVDPSPPVLAPKPAPAPPPRPTPEPVATAPVVPSPPAPVRPPDPRPKAPTPRAPVEDPTELIDKLGRTPSLVRRLALVRGALPVLSDWPVDRVGELIEQFPEGWPRRRALSAIFGAGIPRDRHRAVYLIERLESPISRRWCARQLLRRSGWSERERKALIQRHALPRSSGRRSPATVAGG